MKQILKLIVIILIFLYQNSYAQQNTDGKFIFKTWLFIEHINNQSRFDTAYPVKDFNLFSQIIYNTDLKLDTLRSIRFPNCYTFLRLILSVNNSNSFYKPIIYTKEKGIKEYFRISASSSCQQYVLCVNRLSGKSFRIQGFDGNDFFSLLNDLNFQLSFPQKAKKLTIKRFLRDFGVDGIDFNCIYKGLSSGECDYEKYPCLYNCNGSRKVIWIN